MKGRLFGISLIVLLSAAQGCTYGVQTTSGAAYLEKYADLPKNAAALPAKPGSFSEQLKLAARVEPVLKFPARIGLAKLVQGSLVSIPEKEAGYWEDARAGLDDDIGDFVLLSPLGMQLASEAVSAEVEKTYYANGAINQIRLAAARQHLDAVLIYEAVDSFESSRNWLSVLDAALVTLAILPSRSLSSRGSANAILLDVMQGYHYGSAQAQSKEKHGVSPAVAVDDARKEMARDVEIEAVRKLSVEVKKMFNRLLLRTAR